MPYEFLARKSVDLTRLGYQCASLQFDFNKEHSCLRITLFDDDRYQDQVTVGIEEEFGVPDGQD